MVLFVIKRKKKCLRSSSLLNTKVSFRKDVKYFTITINMEFTQQHIQESVDIFRRHIGHTWDLLPKVTM